MNHQPGGDPLVVFQQGIDLFNGEQFYDCHEYLEEVWTPTQQPDRWFLQSLIHFAVAFHHHQKRNKIGAVRQLEKGIKKIQAYLPEWDGVVTGEIEQAARECLRVIEADGVVETFPRIRQTAPWPGLREAIRQ